MSAREQVVYSAAMDLARLIDQVQRANRASPDEMLQAIGSALMGYVRDHTRSAAACESVMRQVTEDLLRCSLDPNTPIIDASKETPQ